VLQLAADNEVLKEEIERLKAEVQDLKRQLDSA
jgi:uncharacterized small protein (DUF1192 family)